MTVISNQLDPVTLRSIPAQMQPMELELQTSTYGGSENLLRRWIAILLRWRWVILGVVALALLIGIAATLLMTRMYSASVSMEISREGANVINIQGVEPKAGGTIDQEFYQTQYGLLRSRSLAEAVATELRLPEDRAFFEMFGEGDTIGPATEGRTTPLPAATRADRLRLAATILLDHFSVDPLRASRLVTLRFESPDPEFSARVANAWAEQFIAKNLERRFDATAYARRFLEQRLAQIRERLEASERQLVAYAANNRIITIGSPSNEEGERAQERSVTTDNLIALNEQLAAVRGARIAAESRLGGNAGRASSESLTNPALSTLRQRRAEIAAERARLLTQFQPDYPPVQALGAQLQQIDVGIAREEARINATVQGQYRETIGREQELAQRVAQLERAVIDQRRRGIQYNIFQRDVDTNRELYDALLQRYKEIGVAGGIGTNNVSIVDQALPPIKPSKPRPLLNLVLALVLGLIAGIAAAFALEQIDEALSDTNDVESKLKLSALGSIPRLTGESPLDAIKDRKSAISEAYLSVATALKFSTSEGVPRSLLVTSTRPAEGKSTTSIALAITLARLGYRTLLVDGDMRSPSLHTQLDVPNEAGLSNVLSGEPVREQMLVSLDQPNLMLLPAGPTPPNAAELLSGSHLDEVLTEMGRRFEIVVVDAPPVMGLADAPLIASKTQGTLMVVEARGTRSRQAQVALRRLQNSRARILGAILTKFDAQRAHYGYGYEYGYGYGHADPDQRSPANA